MRKLHMVNGAPVLNWKDFSAKVASAKAQEGFMTTLSTGKDPG